VASKFLTYLTMNNVSKTSTANGLGSLLGLIFSLSIAC